MSLPEDLQFLKSWLASASNREIRRLGEDLFPDESIHVAYFRVSALRLYAIRMNAQEWTNFILNREPTEIVIDENDAALLRELLRQS